MRPSHSLSSPDDLYLTAGQVAELLHVSTKTVHRWAEQGLLPCTFTLGGHRRFKLSDVESAVAETERRDSAADQPDNGDENGGGKADAGAEQRDTVRDEEPGSGGEQRAAP